MEFPRLFFRERPCVRFVAYVEEVIRLFGWDRVVWGSDHPVVTLFADLTRWVEASRAIVAGCSEDEQARLFFSNAERVYRLG